MTNNPSHRILAKLTDGETINMGAKDLIENDLKIDSDRKEAEIEEVVLVSLLQSCSDRCLLPEWAKKELE
jgi:hypothetical protein